MASTSTKGSSGRYIVEQPLRIGKYSRIQQYLVDRGVNPQSARQAASSELSNWSLDEIVNVFQK